MEKQRRAGVLTLTLLEIGACLSCAMCSGHHSQGSVAAWAARPALSCMREVCYRLPETQKPSVSREGGTHRAQSQSQCPSSTAHFPGLTESTQDRHGPDP